MKNWSRIAGLAVGGLPVELVEGEAEQVGGGEHWEEFVRLGNCLESLEDATYQVWKWMSWKICTNIYIVF